MNSMSIESARARLASMSDHIAYSQKHDSAAPSGFWERQAVVVQALLDELRDIKWQS